MLKIAFGNLKLASTCLSKEPDEVSSFLTFVGNKVERYNDIPQNMVHQAICQVILRADNGYYEQSYLGNYYSYAHPTYTAPISQTSCSPMSEPARGSYTTTSSCSPLIWTYCPYWHHSQAPSNFYSPLYLLSVTIDVSISQSTNSASSFSISFSAIFMQWSIQWFWYQWFDLMSNCL